MEELACFERAYYPEGFNNAAQAGKDNEEEKITNLAKEELIGLFALSGFSGGASGRLLKDFGQFSINFPDEMFKIFGQIFGQGFDQSLGEGKNNTYSVQYYPA